MRKAAPYGNNRNPELPWGYWLTVNDHAHPPLLDEEGRGWHNVREYFWVAHLGMKGGGQQEREQALEVLLSVLAAIDRQVVPIEEKVIDLFGNSWHLCRQFFGPWLEGRGLTEHGVNGRLTSEGKAVLKMLASTRGRHLALVPIGLPVFRALDGPVADDDPVVRDAIMQQCEAFASQLAYRFARIEIAGKPAITFTGPPVGDNVPLARMLWSMSFPRAQERDRLYRWLVDRIDRWESWAERIRRNGAQALSEHLLRLRFADGGNYDD